jgi:hypothetical protein
MRLVYPDDPVLGADRGVGIDVCAGESTSDELSTRLLVGELVCGDGFDAAGVLCALVLVGLLGGDAFSW